MKILLIAISIFFSVTVFADVPHTLVDGNVVDASQLNENFSYLDGEYTVRANGVTIGSVASWINSSSYLQYVKLRSSFEKVNINNDGTIEIPAIGDDIKSFYKNADCLGDPYAYVGVYGATNLNFSPMLGKIYLSNSQLYYYPKNAQLYRFATQSMESPDGTCQNENRAGYIFVKLLPNDSTVTGIQTYPFPTPISIDGVNSSLIFE